MKSLRYILVVCWVCTMTSLGLFSDIGSLKNLFDNSYRGGDANTAGVVISDWEAQPKKTAPAKPLITPHQKAPLQKKQPKKVCKKSWLTCKKKKKCKLKPRKVCRKNVRPSPVHSSIQQADTTVVATAFVPFILTES